MSCANFCQMIAFFKLWFEKDESSMTNDFPDEKTTKLVYLIDIGEYSGF